MAAGLHSEPSWHRVQAANAAWDGARCGKAHSMGNANAMAQESRLAVRLCHLSNIYAMCARHAGRGATRKACCAGLHLAEHVGNGLDLYTLQVSIPPLSVLQPGKGWGPAGKFKQQPYY